MLRQPWLVPIDLSLISSCPSFSPPFLFLFLFLLSAVPPACRGCRSGESSLPALESPGGLPSAPF